MEIEKERRFPLHFEQVLELMKLMQQARQWERLLKSVKERKKSKEKLKKCLQGFEKMKKLSGSWKPDDFSLNPGFSSSFNSNDILNYARVISHDLHNRVGVKNDDNTKYPTLARRPDEIEGKSVFYFYSSGNPKGKVLPKPILSTDAGIRFQNPGTNTQYYFTLDGSEPTRYNCHNEPNYINITTLPNIQLGEAGSSLKVRFEKAGYGPSMVTTTEIGENEGTTDMMIRANIDEVIDTWILTDINSEGGSSHFENN